MMPVYKDGLSVLAGKAKKAMAEGHVRARRGHGSDAYVEYPCNGEFLLEPFHFGL